MNAKWWRDGAAVMLCAMLVAGCASPHARADAQYSQVAAPPASVNAAPAASERPSDAQAGFRRGLPRLSGPRTILARSIVLNSPPIIFLHSAITHSIILRSRNMTREICAARRKRWSAWTELYPESVMLDRAELQLGETLAKLGRNQEASALAARLLARLPDPPIEQGARIVEARALIALGNPKAAYTQLMTLRDKYPRSDSDTEARALVHSILASNPDVVDSRSLTYHREESGFAATRGAAGGGERAGESRASPWRRSLRLVRNCCG